MAARHRLLDVVDLVETDPRAQVVFTVAPDAFDNGAPDRLRGLGAIDQSEPGAAVAIESPSRGRHSGQQVECVCVPARVAIGEDERTAQMLNNRSTLVVVARLCR